MIGTPVLGSPIGSSRHARRESIAPSQVNSTSVKVVVRIRPPDETAVKLGARFQKTVVHPRDQTTVQLDLTGPGLALAGSGATVSKAASGNKVTFTFDRVIGPDEGQSAVYDETRPLVDAFLAGMNVTVLAYGQTSSGKSYTMGTDRTIEVMQEEEWAEDRLGITPRAVAEIFDRIKEIREESKGATTFKIKLSYVELYNEDLIDLLAGDREARPTVQIREDVKGKIIWSGLREVPVTSAIEVMNYLTAGSSLRQTGSTDMNSQSSRSHAIFSLTLEQTQYTGSGTPPSSSPPASRLPSRASMLPRVTSPTPGSRSSTPTQERPGSRMGIGLGLRTPGTIRDDEKSDTWSTVTSKFHFVDLAGSERLKRTAVAGERVKEGISINSGLHALGNVISALGDPTKKATHVPYRDSKLTRLLQDSLGGNARTLMIACTSATELNLNETLSTLKYANRARNIKNRAEINAVEVGWDDVEYLQRTVTKLRAELAGLRTGDEGVISAITVDTKRHSTQSSSSSLRDRFAQHSAELATAQLSLSGVSPSSMSREDFAAAIEPVVEEYEKSLSALEGQLSLTKAALAHSEDEIREWEARFEEEHQAREAQEVTIDELKARNSKLSERELTTELYVRDLEAKLKDYGELDDSRGSEVSDLRKELSKAREERERMDAYISDVETKLSAADDNASTLKSQIDLLERDIRRREESYRELESRLSILDTSGDHRMLLQEVDAKNQRLLELEREVDDLKSRSSLAEQEKQRLEKLVAEEKDAKDELHSRVRTLERASTLSSSDIAAQAGKRSLAANGNTDSEPRPSEVVVSALEHQIYKLQQAHDATVAQLEAVNAKYRDSLKEIEQLSTRSGFEDTSQAASPIVDETSSSDPQRTPPPASRTPRTRRSIPLAPQHRLSFLSRGQGAAATATHTPRSPSLSEQLSSAVSSQVCSPPSRRLSSPSSSSINRESIYGTIIPTNSDKNNETEVLKLQSALRDRENEIHELHQSLRRLRGEASQNSSPRLPRNSTSSSPPDLFGEPSLLLTPKTRGLFEASRVGGQTETSRFDDLLRAMAQKESFHRETVDGLAAELASVRRQHDELLVLSRNQVENMSSEISRLRDELDGRADAAHFEDRIRAMQDALDAKTAELERARQDAEEQLLSATTRLEVEHRREMDERTATILALKQAHASVLHEASCSRQAAEARANETDDAAARALTAEHTQALQSLRELHEAALQAKADEMDAALSDQQRQHESAMDELRVEHGANITNSSREVDQISDELRAQHEEAVKSVHEQYARQLDELKRAHEAALQTQSKTADGQLEKLRNEHSSALADKEKTHDIALDQLRDEHAQVISGLKTSHETAACSAQADFHDQLHEKSVNFDAQVERMRNEHLDAVEAIRGDLQQAQETKAAELEEQAQSLSSKHAQDLEEITLRHERAIQELEASHNEQVKSLRAAQEAESARLAAAKNDELSRLRRTHESSLANAATAHAAELNTLEERLAAAHRREMDAAKADKAAELQDWQSRVERLESDLARAQQERDSLKQQASRLSIGQASLLSVGSHPYDPSSDGGQLNRAVSPASDAGRSPQARSEARFSLGKPPPPTPPPSVPPPPLPTDSSSSGNGLSSRGLVRSPSSSSIRRHSLANGALEGGSIRPESVVSDDRIRKRLGEQDAMIARLTKQLTHCESDLQANIDLVNTLESALNDSERNLRKARTMMADLTRERDAYVQQNDQLRQQVRDAHHEVENVRHSVIDAETRLQEEKFGRDSRARELERRLDEANRQRKSKFACF